MTDIDNLIVARALFLFSSTNCLNLDYSVDTAFKEIATSDFVRDITTSFDITTEDYIKSVKRRVVNAINNERLKKNQLS